MAARYKAAVQRVAFLVAILVSSSAHADPDLDDATYRLVCEETAITQMNERVCTRLRPQVQADLGLSVVYVGYEVPIARRWALQLEGGISGTYFLPWFDLGDAVAGFGGGTRLTWFARRSGHGPYLAPYLRVNRISGEDEAGADHAGVAIAAGVFIGWAWRVTRHVDLRLGIGAQYFYVDAPPLGASTPFVALDAVLGYRL